MWAHQNDSSKLGSAAAGGVCWQDALMWQGTKRSIKHLMGLASSLFGQETQNRAWGTWDTLC